MGWFSRFTSARHSPRPLGPLEWGVLEALWTRGAPASVRDLGGAFPRAAYTTLMTTLERLHRKGIVSREKQGRAFHYEPRMTRAEFEAEQAAAAMREALRADPGAVRPLMSFFVDAVSDRDRALLDELDALVQARRSQLRRRQP